MFQNPCMIDGLITMIYGINDACPAIVSTLLFVLGLNNQSIHIECHTLSIL